ncbi:VanZ family protein [Deinococcus fonticola]|uniref:VanZ family protein n=1 Tax=Deinococcus fonticola TaxID=2528713 RepID=UPI0030B8558D
MSQARAAKPAWWLPTLLLMGVIWLLSSGARTPGPALPHPLDWAAHGLGYLALGFCLGKATGQRQLAWVLAAWFGALDEVHQAFVPPREAGVVDWLFDLLGAFVGSRLALPLAPPASLHIELEFGESANTHENGQAERLEFHENAKAS